MFQQRCDDCKREWNAAFGITGTVYTALPPTSCEYCKSTKITRIAEGWKKDEKYISGTKRS